ncbi:MAG: VIT1/CCC1 transporter family protein [Anaerolineae bacterium]
MDQGHSPDNKKLIADLKQAWQMEVSGARTYRQLAAHEPNAERRTILTRMAEAEDHHAERWADRLKELGEQLPQDGETASDRLRRWVLVQTGTDTAAQHIENAEAYSDRLYASMLKQATDEKDRTALQEIQAEERAHGRVLQDMTGQAPPSELDRILKGEKWHVRGGGWIGQAIYGLNDGLGAAFGVVSGVAGATAANGQFVLLSGIAAAVASALSMGSGAYLATKSEREVYEAEIGRERREIESHPEEEQEELELFYQLKGFNPEEAKLLAARLAAQPEQLLKTLAHEELGLSEQNFPRPWNAALSATIATGIGAIIPVLPFFFMQGTPAVIVSFVISTLAHFAVGASKVIVTGRSWMVSGAEMTIVGLGEAITTYVIGLLISPAIKL